jgi:hypothetical protein
MKDIFIVEIGDFTDAIIFERTVLFRIFRIFLWFWIYLFLLYLYKFHEFVDIIYWIIFSFVVLLAARAVHILMLLAS